MIRTFTFPILLTALLASPVTAQTTASSGDVSPSIAPVVRTANCPGGASVQALLDASTLARPIDIRIIGPCTENITVRRDDVTLRGRAPDTLSTIITGKIFVDGSSRVLLQDMQVKNGPDIGIFATRGSSVQIDNVLVRDHPNEQVGIARGSVARIDGSLFVGSSTSDTTLFAADGSMIRMFTSRVLATRNQPQSGIVLGVYRQSSMRIEGGNEIRHVATSSDLSRANLALVVDNSDLRIQRSGNTAEGNVRIQTNSSMDIRDVSVVGNFQIGGMGIVQMMTGGGITGNVEVRRRGMIEVVSSGYTGVTGAVTCTGEGAIADHTGTLTGAGCTVLP